MDVVYKKNVVGADLEHGGPDTIVVNVAINLGASDAPQYARVTLLRAKDKMVVRQAWSDPETGVATFSGVNTERHHYISLAEYPSNPDDPNAENYLRPVAGVSPLRGQS